jgi:hypothetical protein
MPEPPIEIPRVGLVVRAIDARGTTHTGKLRAARRIPQDPSLAVLTLTCFPFFHAEPLRVWYVVARDVVVSPDRVQEHWRATAKLRDQRRAKDAKVARRQAIADELAMRPLRMALQGQEADRALTAS